MRNLTDEEREHVRRVTMKIRTEIEGIEQALVMDTPNDPGTYAMWLGFSHVISAAQSVADSIAVGVTPHG